MVFYNNSIVGLNLDLTSYWFDYTGNHKPTRHVKAPVIGVGFFFWLFWNASIFGINGVFSNTSETFYCMICSF